MSKGRRQMPSTTEGRRRKIELGQIISNPMIPVETSFLRKEVNPFLGMPYCKSGLAWKVRRRI